MESTTGEAQMSPSWPGARGLGRVALESEEQRAVMIGNAGRGSFFAVTCCLFFFPPFPAWASVGRLVR
jgi:hypothetical protein